MGTWEAPRECAGYASALAVDKAWCAAVCLVGGSEDQHAHAQHTARRAALLARLGRRLPSAEGSRPWTAWTAWMVAFVDRM